MAQDEAKKYSIIPFYREPRGNIRLALETEYDPDLPGVAIRVEQYGREGNAETTPSAQYNKLLEELGLPVPEPGDVHPIIQILQDKHTPTRLVELESPEALNIPVHGETSGVENNPPRQHGKHLEWITQGEITKNFDRLTLLVNQANMSMILLSLYLNSHLYTDAEFQEIKQEKLPYIKQIICNQVDDEKKFFSSPEALKSYCREASEQIQKLIDADTLEEFHLIATEALKDGDLLHPAVRSTLTEDIAIALLGDSPLNQATRNYLMNNNAHFSTPEGRDLVVMLTASYALEKAEGLVLKAQRISDDLSQSMLDITNLMMNFSVYNVNEYALYGDDPLTSTLTSSQRREIAKKAQENPYSPFYIVHDGRHDAWGWAPRQNLAWPDGITKKDFTPTVRLHGHKEHEEDYRSIFNEERRNLQEEWRKAFTQDVLTMEGEKPLAMILMGGMAVGKTSVIPEIMSLLEEAGLDPEECFFQRRNGDGEIKASHNMGQSFRQAMGAVYKNFRGSSDYRALFGTEEHIGLADFHCVYAAADMFSYMIPEIQHLMQHEVPGAREVGLEETGQISAELLDDVTEQNLPFLYDSTLRSSDRVGWAFDRLEGKDYKSVLIFVTGEPNLAVWREPMRAAGTQNYIKSREIILESIKGATATLDKASQRADVTLVVETTGFDYEHGRPQYEVLAVKNGKDAELTPLDGYTHKGELKADAFTRCMSYQHIDPTGKTPAKVMAPLGIKYDWDAIHQPEEKKKHQTEMFKQLRSNLGEKRGGMENPSFASRRP